METLQLSLLPKNSLNSSPEDFPVKTFHAPTPTGEGWKVNDQDCFTNLSESFASADPVTSYWKTSQRCFQSKTEGIWAQFSGSFPKAGMMRSGKLYRHPQWVRHTCVKEFSLLPTPVASDHKSATSQSVSQAIIHRGKSPRLGEYVAAQTPGQLNPEFVEWLMGFPIGYTELEDSETP